MKNHNLVFTILTTVFVVYFFESCSKSRPANPDTGYATHEVYIAGTYQDDTTYTERAAYWKNGVMTLVGGVNSNATGICVVGSDVYVTGDTYGYGSRMSRTYVGNVWKNGVNIPLASAYPGNNTTMPGNGSNNICGSNGDIYIAGSDNNHATVWKNGIPKTLDTSSRISSGFSVFVSGSDVYVSGCISEYTSCCYIYRATLWKNGVPVSLGQANSIATSVFVNGSDVYVGGYDDANPTGSSGHFNAATFWKNGTPIQLDNVNPSQVNSIYVDGTNVYAVGGNTLWENGKAFNLNQGAGTFCMAVVAKNGEIFMAGSAPLSIPYNTNYNSVAYWHNGSVFGMPLYGYGSALFVK